MNLNNTLTQLTDVALLEALCSNTQDKAYYTEFVNRFIGDLYFFCDDICKKRKLDKHVGKEITHETFSNVRKYKSFKTDEIKLPNNRTAILVYLKRIAINLFYDLHNTNKKKAVVHKTYFDDILEENQRKLDAVNLSEKRDLANYVFNKLNKKEQTVVLADIKHKKFQKYLPDDITEHLSLELNVKKESIRKIRERAIEKINKAIKEFNEN